MSTAVATPEALRPSAARPSVVARPTFLGVLRGEWIKLLSLRSTWWVLAATVLLITGVSLAVAFSLDATAADPATAGGVVPMRGADVVSGGFQLGMLTIAVLGALLITGEYSTGMIRSTLAAVPTRVPVLVAKAIAVAVLTAVVGAVGIALSYLVTSPLLADHDLVPALDDAETWQVFGGTVYFLVAAALFSLGVGTVLRSSAGAITVALTVLLLLPGVLLHQPRLGRGRRRLPAAAGVRVLPRWWGGLAVLGRRRALRDDRCAGHRRLRDRAARRRCRRAAPPRRLTGPGFFRNGA